MARGADFLQAAVIRPLMFVLWCGVLWGSFILLAWGWVLVSDGGASAMHAFARLSWANRLSGLLALAVWSLAAAILWQRRTAGERQ